MTFSWTPPNATGWTLKSCKRPWQRNLQRNERKRPRREPSRRAARRPRPIPLDSRRSASSHSAIFYGIGARRSGVNGPQPRPLKLSFGNAQPGTIRAPVRRPISFPSRPSLSNPIPPEPPSGAAFRSMASIFILSFLETFSNPPGSNPITTRRFTCKWQDETPGVTQLVNGAWSSVSQR